MDRPTRTSRRTLLAAALGGAAATGLTGHLHHRRPRLRAGPILKPLPAGLVRRLRHQRRDALGLGRRRTATGPGSSRLFVRNHTVTPPIDPRPGGCASSATGWRRARRGRGAQLSSATCGALPRTRITSVHECTGNGRSFFATQQGTPAPGTAVDARRGRHGDLGGRPAAPTCSAASGCAATRSSIQATGLDPTLRHAAASTTAAVRRPFPVAKALDDALLAWGMNGEPLLPDHGFPLRLVLPGWVGIASIKWLGSLEVADAPAHLAVEHEVVPDDRRRLPRRQPAADRQPGALGVGAAWDADRAGRRGTRAHRPLVERAGADREGRRQHRRRRDLAARRLDRAGRRRWTQWRVPLAAPDPAATTLMARATDAPDAPSRWSRRTTTRATSSTPSSGTRVRVV